MPGLQQRRVRAEERDRGIWYSHRLGMSALIKDCPLHCDCVKEVQHARPWPQTVRIYNVTGFYPCGRPTNRSPFPPGMVTWQLSGVLGSWGSSRHPPTAMRRQQHCRPGGMQRCRLSRGEGG